jgi:hypothetical protein
MKRAKKKKAKKVLVVYCHYEGKNVPLGRSRKRCPKCGAVLGKTGTSHVPFSVIG